MEINATTPASPAGFSPAKEGQPAHEDRESFGQEAAESQHGEQNQPGATTQLTESEQREVQKMRRREQEVRTHEQAHRSVGGRYVRGGINYEYEAGPDGKRYITGGEVSIDTSAIAGDPEATLEKMRTIKRAALAPAQPSQQDRAVAAQASRAMVQAQQELAEQKSEAAGLGETKETGEDQGPETVAGGTEPPENSQRPQSEAVQYQPNGLPSKQISPEGVHINFVI